MTYTKCEICGTKVSLSNISKHTNSKSCLRNKNGYVKLRLPEFINLIDDKYECTDCKKSFSKNGIYTHVWRVHTTDGLNFKENNRGYENGSRIGWNKGLTKDTNERVLLGSIKWKESFSNGDFEIKGACTKEWNQSEYGRECSSRGGGYRENAGRSKKYKVKDSFGKIVTLQSSYELLCSEILNELGILWIRPSYLVYDDRKYFPDFYLVDLDIYLDPKNDYLAKIDEEKINKVIEQNSVKVLILTKEFLTKSFFRTLPEWSKGVG